jgi:hypothetical protein
MVERCPLGAAEFCGARCSPGGRFYAALFEFKWWWNDQKERTRVPSRAVDWGLLDPFSFQILVPELTVGDVTFLPAHKVKGANQRSPEQQWSV